MGRVTVRAWSFVLGFLLLLSAMACTKPKSDTPPDDSAPVAKAGQVKLVIAYGSEKKTWFDEQVAAFKATHPLTKFGQVHRRRRARDGLG